MTAQELKDLKMNHYGMYVYRFYVESEGYYQTLVADTKQGIRKLLSEWKKKGG